MDNVEVASTLNDIADNMEKIAESIEEKLKYNKEKIAVDKAVSLAAEQDYGVLGQSPSKGVDVLLDFCLS